MDDDDIDIDYDDADDANTYDNKPQMYLTSKQVAKKSEQTSKICFLNKFNRRIP